MQNNNCEAKKIDFDDLDDDTMRKLVFEAFQSLVDDNSVPYGIMNGDDGVWYEYDPAIELARKDYYES